LDFFFNHIEEKKFVDNLVLEIKKLEESGCIFGILVESAQ
jgi:hypothetical protein